MKPSIYDIAKMAGVSTATVSRVLNNTGQISAGARSAVLKAMRDADYVPRGSGGVKPKRGFGDLSGKDSRIIELVFCFSHGGELLRIDDRNIEVEEVDELPPEEFVSNDSSFYRPISEGAIDEARRFGYKTIMHCIRKDSLNDPAFMQSLYDDNICGLLLAGEQPDGLSEFLRNFKLPVVLVDMMAGNGAVEVTSDNMEGISQAFEHLYALGHRKTGFMLGDESLPAYRERYLSFAYKMAEKGLKTREDWIYRGSNHVVDSVQWGQKLFRKKDIPTAFLCTNDYCALGLLRAAMNSGIKVPKDLSIVGFDDIETSNLVTPPLTTVNVPKTEIGRCSARELIVSLKNGKRPLGSPQCRLRLSPTLVKRESTAAVRKQGA
ncbi:MAG TPA: hypothetical protein DET40_17145 [Lentisphaeria bacterium]|nr:MAG: hypothetical protein A2X45_02860 [Lentisphaerae bacterium GWF2_50_93]HCE45268.1 hypothetical protein [Lentisphaeria bacterium]